MVPSFFILVEGRKKRTFITTMQSCSFSCSTDYQLIESATVHLIPGPDQIELHQDRQHRHMTSFPTSQPSILAASTLPRNYHQSGKCKVVAEKLKYNQTLSRTHQIQKSQSHRKYQQQQQSFHEDLLIARPKGRVTPPLPPHLSRPRRKKEESPIITTLPSPPEPPSFAVSALVSLSFSVLIAMILVYRRVHGIKMYSPEERHTKYSKKVLKDISRIYGLSPPFHDEEGVGKDSSNSQNHF